MLYVYYEPVREKDPFQPAIVVLPDGDVKGYTDKIVGEYQTIKRLNPTHDNEIYVGQELIILAFRVAVRSGKLDHKDIMFRFHGNNLPIDKEGRIHPWPKGFCKQHEDLLVQLF